MPHPEPPRALSRKPFITRLLFWCLIPVAVFHSWPITGLSALIFLGLARSALALATLVPLAFLEAHGAAGWGAAAFLYAAWGGRMSPLELVAVSALAGGLSGLTAAGAVLVAGLGAAVAGGFWRRYGPQNVDWKSIGIGGCVGAVVLALAGATLWTLADHTAALFFLEARGQIIRADVGSPADGESRVGFWLNVKYEYGVHGRTWRGSRYQVGRSERTEEEASRRVAAYRRRVVPVTVYYAPWDPSQSVLSREVSETDRMLLLFGGLFGCLPWLGLFLRTPWVYGIGLWWSLTILVSWHLVSFAGNILPLFLVGGVLAVGLASHGRTVTTI